MHSPSPVEYSLLTYIWFLFILYRNMEISLLRRGSIFEQAHTFYMSSKSDSQLPLILCPQPVKKVPTQAQGVKAGRRWSQFRRQKKGVALFLKNPFPVRFIVSDISGTGGKLDRLHIWYAICLFLDKYLAPSR